MANPKLHKNLVNYNTEERIKELMSLNMSFDGAAYTGNLDINKDFNVHSTEILCDTNYLN